MWTSSSPENSYWIPAKRTVGRVGQWEGRGSGEGGAVGRAGQWGRGS